MSNPTPLKQLIEIRLGEPITDFISRRRPGKSWRQIADEVGDKAGVAVTHETLRGWANETEPAA